MSGSDGDATVIQGDCLEVLEGLDAGSAALVYADPPFATGTRRRGPDGRLGYEDRWEDLASWGAFLEARLRAAHRVLAEDGAILVHVDWRTSHHVRFMLERIFGPERFVNHLVWRYGLGGSAGDRFARKHDDILYFARGDRRWFEPPMVPATSRRMQGRLKKATDVLDVPAINNMARERTGWPDQKPLRLLDLLIRACCPPGGLVLDPFCGSGTTVVAAVRAGRRGLGIDRRPEAVRIARARLEAPSSPEPADHESPSPA